MNGFLVVTSCIGLMLIHGGEFRLANADSEAGTVWKRYQQDPYSEKALALLAKELEPNPLAAFPKWFISGVFQAERKGKSPLWVVQVYDGDQRGFDLGCLLVLTAEGKHLRTLARERIHWSLVQHKAKGLPDWMNELAAAPPEGEKLFVELIDLNDDGFAEIPTERWRPVRGELKPGEKHALTSIYRSDDDAIPCALCIEFFSRWPAAGLLHGSCRLEHNGEKKSPLVVASPVYVKNGEFSYRVDESQPPKPLGEFRWSPDDKTWHGPAAGPGEIWVVQPRE